MIHMLCVGGPRHGEIVQVAGKRRDIGAVEVAVPDAPPLVATYFDPNNVTGRTLTTSRYVLQPTPIHRNGIYAGIHPDIQARGEDYVREQITNARELAQRRTASW